MADKKMSAVPRTRLVIDANIYLSSLRKSEQANQLLEACIEGTLVAIYSQHLLGELEDVYSRDKFRKWFTLEEGAALVAAIKLVGTEVPDRLPGDWPLDGMVAVYKHLLALVDDSHMLV